MQSPQPRKRFFRTEYLINPRFQLSFLTLLLPIMILTISIFFLANHYFFEEYRKTALAIGLQSNHLFFQFLDQQQRELHWAFSIAGFVSILLLSVGGLLLSHRVAGPLYRLWRHIRDVTAGKTHTFVSFRKGDFFHDLADAYNDVLKKIYPNR